jgi:sugar phosphate isomerase/epimerase
MCYGHDGAGALRRSLESGGVGRRTFLRGLVAAAAAGAATTATAAPALATPPALRPVPPGQISIQLYTLRAATGSWDAAQSVLSTLAEIGYPRVELAGTYGRSAAELRAFLDGVGIWPSSSHVGISSSPAALDAKIADALTLGHDYINVPFLVSGVAADWQRWAEQMNAEAAVARAAGIRYGYHNHAHEFTTTLDDGSTPWEILTSELDPSLVHLEVDLYWAVTGGIGVGAADPVGFAIDVIHESPQPVLQYHVKDRHEIGGDMADLGTGFIDFSRIFAAHRVREYIVENDTPDVTPLQTAEVGYAYLRNVRF